MLEENGGSGRGGGRGGRGILYTLIQIKISSTWVGECVCYVIPYSYLANSTACVCSPIKQDTRCPPPPFMQYNIHHSPNFLLAPSLSLHLSTSQSLSLSLSLTHTQMYTNYRLKHWTQHGWVVRWSNTMISDSVIIKWYVIIKELDFWTTMKWEAF